MWIGLKWGEIINLVMVVDPVSDLWSVSTLVSPKVFFGTRPSKMVYHFCCSKEGLKWEVTQQRCL